MGRAPPTRAASARAERKTEQYTDADFGFTAPGTIGDFIWQDTNGNGSQDFGEPGTSGVTVTLYRDANNNGVYDPGTDTQVGNPQVTGTSGLYGFTGLPAGNYVVNVTTVPSRHTQTYDPNASDPLCAPSGMVIPCNLQAPATLAVGQVDRSLDFGFRPLGVIGDTVWLNSNGNSTRDAGEVGIAGVTVQLRDTAGTTVIATTTTDINGYYSFGNVADGTYTVVVVNPPSSYLQNYDPDAVSNGQTTVVMAGGQATSVGSSCTNPPSSCDLRADFGYRLDVPLRHQRDDLLRPEQQRRVQRRA